MKIFGLPKISAPEIFVRLLSGPKRDADKKACATTSNSPENAAGNTSEPQRNRAPAWTKDLSHSRKDASAKQSGLASVKVGSIPLSNSSGSRETRKFENTSHVDRREQLQEKLSFIAGRETALHAQRDVVMSRIKEIMQQKRTLIDLFKVDGASTSDFGSLKEALDKLGGVQDPLMAKKGQIDKKIKGISDLSRNVQHELKSMSGNTRQPDGGTASRFTESGPNSRQASVPLPGTAFTDKAIRDSGKLLPPVLPLRVAHLAVMSSAKSIEVRRDFQPAGDNVKPSPPALPTRVARQTELTSAKSMEPRRGSEAAGDGVKGSAPGLSPRKAPRIKTGTAESVGPRTASEYPADDIKPEPPALPPRNPPVSV